MSALANIGQMNNDDLRVKSMLSIDLSYQKQGYRVATCHGYNETEIPYFLRKIPTVRNGCGQK